jgi:hypothetical protein
MFLRICLEYCGFALYVVLAPMHDTQCKVDLLCPMYAGVDGSVMECSVVR